MKFLDEYRGGKETRTLAREIARACRGSWRIMEVCGGQTHSIVRFGLQELLPPGVTLIHGPGCPVCVTPLELIDNAIELALQPNVIFCSFGDMLRVPGSRSDLLSAKASGADVRIVYSPLDAVRLAEAQPGREVVFFAVGFETTAPATALAVLQARAKELRNFSLLVAHVLVPPAMGTILQAPGCRIQAFLAAGHVCAVMGAAEYEPLARQFRVPVVITGFEPVDILEGILRCVRQLEDGRSDVENQYARAVRYEGNPMAVRTLQTVYEPAARKWRGIGEIPMSGLRLRSEFAVFDAQIRFPLKSVPVAEPSQCRSGEVLQGRLAPPQCQSFGTRCTPDNPLGAPMVSSEGACAAYYRYKST